MEKQQIIDVEMAARTARRHNGGHYKFPISELKNHDPHDYVKRIYGDPGFVLAGNFPSFRCVSNSGLSERNGLLMSPLNLQGLLRK